MMIWLSILHRWTGAFIGLLLALMGLSGAILLWEGEWVSLPGANDPLAENAVQIAAVTDACHLDLVPVGLRRASVPACSERNGTS